MIMMEMTDFTRGKGPLQTTMAVIEAAKKISEAGTKLDTLARKIADQCPESTTKKDLLAYLERIRLYCHQLNITSRVKADVQNVSGECNFQKFIFRENVGFQNNAIRGKSDIKLNVFEMNKLQQHSAVDNGQKVHFEPKY